MHSTNWDDLRFVLAVADEGSVSAAARRLFVNHATVLRRIAAYEDRIGTQIFERTPQGYLVSPDHARVIDAAREVQAAMTAVDRVVQGVESALSGVVRITSTDTMCATVLPKIAASLRDAGPDLQVEICATNVHLDLSQLEADISVRPAPDLPGGMVGEQAGVLGMAAYAPNMPGAYPWLGLRGPLGNVRLPEGADAKMTPQRDGADSFLVLREMVGAGLGRCILPCVLGEADTRVARIKDPALEFGVPLWVASHADIGQSGRLRRIRSRIRDALLEGAEALRGPITPE